MFLPMVLSYLLLAVACVSAHNEFQLDNRFRDIQEPPGVLLQQPNGGPAYYIPPQDFRAIAMRENGALSTIIYFVELYNKLQHIATAFIQPYTVVSKPKPSLAPAAAAVVVGAVPVSQGSVPAIQRSVPVSPEAPGQVLSPEIPAGQPHYTVSSNFYLF